MSENRQDDFSPLPKSVDVAIIGGGIIGVSAALWLASRNVRVALLEKGRIAGEQSGRNWGWCRIAGRDLRELPLMQRANVLWRGMNERVGGDTGYRNCGIVYASKNEQKRERHARWIAATAGMGIDARMLEPREVAENFPGLVRPALGGLFLPGDGRAEPGLAAPLIAEAARAQGAAVVENCAVRAIDVAGGRVCGVITERGAIAAASVIVAGGAWSRLLLKGVGVSLPQLKVLSSACRTAPLGFDLGSCLSFSDFAVRKRLDGGYTIASSSSSVVQIVPDTLRFFRHFLPSFLKERHGMKLRLGKAFVDEALNWRAGDAEKKSIFELLRVLDPSPDTVALDKVRQAIGAAIPAFAHVEIRQSWAGMIDTTPDAIPVISQVDHLPGLVVGTGFSGHGFGIGPAAGELLADLATGERPLCDPQPFRLSRFSEPGGIQLQSWL